MNSKTLIKTRIKLRTILQIYPRAHVFPAQNTERWGIFTENTSCGELIADGRDLPRAINAAFYKVMKGYEKS